MDVGGGVWYTIRKSVGGTEASRPLSEGCWAERGEGCGWFAIFLLFRQAIFPIETLRNLRRFGYGLLSRFAPRNDVEEKHLQKTCDCLFNPIVIILYRYLIRNEAVV